LCTGISLWRNARPDPEGSDSSFHELAIYGNVRQMPRKALRATSVQAVMTIINSAGERMEIPVEIAATDAERKRGLMGRTALAEDAGMFFVFDREQQLSFWMKDTLIPLSIAYINESGRIVDIQDMKPLDETPHPSAEPAKYALEVNQGFFNEHGVEVGNKVSLPGE
jgi:uncharacterized membrane protein (UPF0127 family)